MNGSAKALDEISIDLLKDPYNLKKWQALLKSKQLEVNKLTPKKDLEVIRSIYRNFLSIYPLLHNYWLKFVNVEYEIGNFDACLQIYDDGFKYLSYLVDFWLSYLKFKLDVIPLNPENIKDFLITFEKAREFIGYNYYAYEFYKLYLQFLQTYDYVDPSLKFRKKYEILLRYIIEIPQYNYSWFFDKLLNMYQEDNISYIHHDNKNFKKLVVDIYITTQYKSYKLYDYEKYLKNYYDLKYIPVNQIKRLLRYMEYIEWNYPENYTIQVFERFLISYNNYEDIWIQYMNFLIKRQKYRQLELVMKKCLHLKKFNNERILSKLIDLEIFFKNPLIAKNLIDSDSQNLDKLVNLQWLFNKDPKIFIKLVELNDSFWYLLLFYNFDPHEKMNLFVSHKTDSAIYRKVLGLWLKYNHQFRDKFDFMNITKQQTSQTYDDIMKTYV